MYKNTKRIFIGIPVSEHLKNSLMSWREAHRELSVRWIYHDGWHITLVPPWTEHDITGVAGALDSIANNIEKFELVIKKISFGPTPRNPRLLWVEGVPSKALEDLRDKVTESIGRNTDNRAFRPHITLARFKTFPGVESLDEKFEYADMVDSLAIYESFPNSVYSLLHRSMLR